MSAASRWLLLVWLIAFPSLLPARDPAPADNGGKSLLPTQDLEAPLESFQPKRPRSEAEADRIKATALFAAGRMAEQKQDFAGALRQYQRALRLDNDALPVLREIVPLAFNLSRFDEAVRYALMSVERDPTDPVLLRRLGMYLSEEGDFERALKLYEKANTLQAGQKPSANNVLLWMELGRDYYATKQFSEASNYFAKVVKALDKPTDFGIDAAQRKAILGKAEVTWQLFGEAFLEADRTAEAVAAFEQGNSAKRDPAALAYNLAQVSVKQKAPAEALEKLEAYFAAHTSSEGTAPYQLLSEVLKQLNQSEQLVERLEKLRAGDKDNVPLAYFLAQQYRTAEKLDQAEAVYRRLLERKRPPLEGFQGLLELYRHAGRTDDLLATLGSAVEKTGSLGPLGDEAKEIAKDKDLVKKLLDAASAQRTADKLTFGPALAAALLALDDKQFEAADEFFNVALKADSKKSAEVLLTWGLDLYLANQYADAAKVFQRGVDESSLPAGNPAFYYYLSSALEMSGKTDEALAAAGKAVEAQKESPRFISRIAWIDYHAKRHDAAKAQYLALLDKFDKHYDSAEIREILRDTRLALSNLAVIAGDLPAAEEWLEQVLDEYPEDIGARNDLGYLWADQNKNLRRAVKMIQRAVESEPKNMAYRDSLGWAFYRLGRFDEAVAEMKIAASAEDPDGVIFDHLADCQIKAGDKAGAIESWNKAIAAFEKAKETEKVGPVRAKIQAAK